MRIALAVLLTGAVFAQSRPSGVVDSTVAGVANLPAQKIAANDLIGISVFDAPELTRTVRVGADGAIRLPMLSSPIIAEGLLPREAEDAIARALKNEEILVSPSVTVTILEYTSRTVSVMGAVKRPATFQVVGRVTLLDALARAEGLTPEAGPEILLSRPQSTLVKRIPVKSLIDAADPALNYVLEGGEEIRVPEARKIFVVGNVKKPGSFPVRDESEITVLRILAMAEGLAPFASKVAYIYRAGAEPSSRRELPIELSRILERKAPDVRLQPDDVLYIPDNKGRRLSVATLEKIVMFGTGATTALIYGAAVR